MPGYTSVAEVLTAYEDGKRVFEDVVVDGADFRGVDLSGIAFYDAKLPGALFDGDLDAAEFMYSDLTGASFAAGMAVNRGRFEHTSLAGACLRGVSLMVGVFESVDASGADLGDCDLASAFLLRTDLTDATITGAFVGDTSFLDMDLGPLCDADLVLWGPSYVDFRSVLRSYHHPGLPRFLVACGVPQALAEYTIDAARAEGEGALESLMRSTFISYGGPDEPFARRLYEALREKHVTTFFFPETARLGRRIGDEVHSRIQEHDRVILVCSRDSLDRPGVRNEVQETFDREARDGGATYLVPIMLDDYVLTGWDDPLAERVRARVVGDFRGAAEDPAVFERQMGRLLAALRKDPG